MGDVGVEAALVLRRVEGPNSSLPEGRRPAQPAMSAAARWYPAPERRSVFTSMVSEPELEPEGGPGPRRRQCGQCSCSTDGVAVNLVK